MSTISPVSSAATTDTQSAASKQLASNFDTFLTLLTTQLQNQDPLAPMDSNQFTQQLVQFSQVEQQINSNDNLKTLISLTKARGASDAVGYLGKTVTITTGDAALQDGAAKWAYGLANDTAATQLTVSDANGKVVYVGTGEKTAGQHDFTWNGRDNAGVTLPDGVYKLTVTGVAADGSSVDAAVASEGRVDEVNMTGSEPLLMIGPMAVPLSEVAAVNA